MKKISPETALMPLAGQNSYAWQRMQQQVARMRKQYGDAQQFLDTFTPELQTHAATHWVRAYIGLAPNLSTVAEGYGKPTAIVWLCLELENINLFAGVKEKMSVKRQKELSELLFTEYGHLKVSEFLLFFHRLKCGRYGRFYGEVSALFITSALCEFMKERHADLAQIIEWQEKAKQEALPSPKGISYQEYLRRKARKQKEEQQSEQTQNEQTQNEQQNEPEHEKENE